MALLYRVGRSVHLRELGPRGADGRVGGARGARCDTSPSGAWRSRLVETTSRRKHSERSDSFLLGPSRHETVWECSRDDCGVGTAVAEDLHRVVPNTACKVSRPLPLSRGNLGERLYDGALGVAALSAASLAKGLARRSEKELQQTVGGFLHLHSFRESLPLQPWRPSKTPGVPPLTCEDGRRRLHAWLTVPP